MAKFAPHMVDPHGDPQTSPQHADPHGFLVWFSFKRHQIHVDWRIVGWSAGCHVDHPCGLQILPWPARKVTEKTPKKLNCKQEFFGIFFVFSAANPEWEIRRARDSGVFVLCSRSTRSQPKSPRHCKKDTFSRS